MPKKLKEWFDRDCAMRLGMAVAANYPELNANDYADEVAAGIAALELKARVKLMADALRTRLPEDYEAAARILAASLGPTLDGETGMFTEGYWLMPVARLVEDHGLDHFATSMALCSEITRRHTAEYAVRPYIVAFPERTLSVMRDWSRSSDLHIRRLSSEGMRPRLPWAKKLQITIDDPEPAVERIAALHADPSKYVRTSVANLMNDIAKDHPERIKELAAELRRDNHPHTDWVLVRGTRSLEPETTSPNGPRA